MKHTEKTFESEICEHLAASGWLHSADDAGYDRQRALYPDDLIAWVKDTQLQEWKKLSALHSGGTEKALLDRVCEVMDKDGSLSVLRHGVKTHNARFDLCQFKPAHGLNPETAARYAKVRLRVMRQVHYSVSNENSIDLVFFANGIPVATGELKTDFTQTVHDAIRQYRQDRLPRDPVAKKTEPLLAFRRRCLVHFAVSTDEVHMTTRLDGSATRFLPFNRGCDGGAGNPPNPAGFRTSYLWEQVLARDSWLQILGSFVHLERRETLDKQGKKAWRETLIFPRFHQWESVNLLVATARTEGAGHTYLVQQSAGSGKTNTISWLAHRLATLHGNGDRKVFDSVVVVTDRTVLDAQLQEAIYQFEHKHGVVECIIDEDGSKSAKLAGALVSSKPIIIVTLQTFPFVLDAIHEQASLRNRRFAIIVDEAHSSMSGVTARKLRAVLTAEQAEEGVEVTPEDVMLAEMQARKLPSNASFFAFTATPKAKTIELFGRRPYPDDPPSDQNKPVAFHTYTMQQAIEEGFILDALRNFTPYKIAWKIAHQGRQYDDKEIDRAEGMKSVVRWVRLHPHNISQKVAIIIEHFREVVAWRLGGEAKAMVVTASRKEAVRYKLALDEYIRKNQYPGIAALVAFSGNVIDPESGPEKFNEYSMNPALKGRQIRDAFDTEEFNVLLVANKYQTGFDQPKLVAMYVDKRLAGVAAVQTLSRLNRTFPGKDQTFVLDFVNATEDIVEAFAPYYRSSELAAVSNPDLIHDQQAKLDATGIYLPEEIEAFALVWFDPKGKQADLQRHIAPAVQRFRDRRDQAEKKKDQRALDALELFRRDLAAFLRAYDFLSQITDYADTGLEKRYVFFGCLAPWLKPGARYDAIDISGLRLTHYKAKSLGKAAIDLGATGTVPLTPLTDLGGGEVHEKEKALLAEIIERVNKLFEGELSDADKIAWVGHMAGKMMENETLAQQARTNTREQFASSPDFMRIFVNTVIEGLDNYGSIASQILGNEHKKAEAAEILLDIIYDRFRVDQPAASAQTP